MLRLSNVLKECGLREVLNILTSGLPSGKYRKMLERYYSTYCHIMESWFPDGRQEIIMTDFKEMKCEKREVQYCFWGIKDYKSGIKINAEPIDWSNVFNMNIEVFVPDCFLENMDPDLLVVEILYQLGNEFSDEIPKNRNKRLFDSISEINTNEKNKIQAIEKNLEQCIHYQCDKRFVENALMEHEEKLKGFIVKWGDILIENGDEFIERAALMKDSKDMLFCHYVAGEMPAVYEYFHKMDAVCPPDLTRCYKRNEYLVSEFRDVDLSDYKDVINEHLRIICEENPICKSYPLVYVRDKFGKTYGLTEIPVFKLLCMEIFVLDKNILDPMQVLAIILFYLEYPIRVSRIQKEHMITRLVNILKDKESS